MESEGVSLPWIHEHLMVPWNHIGKGDCCGRVEVITDGYFCESCKFFVHKKCSESSKDIQHPSHTDHTLQLRSNPDAYCDLCGRDIIGYLSYGCEICDFDIDLHCAKYPPPEVINISETHPHELTLLKEQTDFDCDANCGKIGEDEFPYKCHECDITFHLDCVWHPLEYTTTESRRVSLPLIHKHLMVPWNSLERGDCCRQFESITDGFYCESCDFFVHKKCSESSEYIQHPSHPDHTLQLRNKGRFDYCNACGRVIINLFYCCEICNFNMDIYCTKNPPPELIDIAEMHGHKLTLRKRRIIKFYCSAKCGIIGHGFPYECHECHLAFHLGCLWHPEGEHLLEYTTMDAGERVSLPWIHKHFMMPCNDSRKGDCCGRSESITDGYYCKICDFFVHKKCGDEVYESIKHPSHPIHLIWLRRSPNNKSCKLCGRSIVDLYYRCEICDFDVDLCCVRYPPPKIINICETHGHELTLLKERTDFDCDVKCGKIGEDEFHYKCHTCDVAFHVDCVWHPSELEVNYSYHLLHPLKLLTGHPPEYSDGKCRLCGRKTDDRLFYHCSSCNFTVDMRCILHPPPQSLLDLKAHDHQLTLLSRIRSFICNACGLSGDRSPYMCVQCDFIIHQDCLGIPRIININRHDHRICRTSVLGVVNSVCGVCREKVDWIYGGYSCQRCPRYVVHSKCATKKDVWNGKELEGIPEEIEDIRPYVVIDDNTIQHFSHKEHYLRLQVNSVLYEESKRCRACSHPVCLQSFYSCIDCNFVLHQSCAGFLKKKWHVLHNERLTLVPSKPEFFTCDACCRISNGFVYHHGIMELDVRCGSISEPFIHPSHPHPLYYVLAKEERRCNGCNKWESYVLRCIEDGCEYVLGFKCSTLPQVVKHRVNDHPLSLCYGEEGASGKYWCDICEKESDPRKWFYTCKDHRASLHTKCVLGDCVGLMPMSTIKCYGQSFEVVLNNSVSRPVCKTCESHCRYPIVLKKLGAVDMYFCSYKCVELVPHDIL